jgi:hypothetical protein
MRRQPLAALCLILAAPLAADDSLSKLKSDAGKDATAAAAASVPAAHGTVIAYPGCDEKQQARVQAAIDSALKMVDSCLSGYNKGKMAAAIKKNFNKFYFSCAPETRSSGGVTTHDADGQTLKAAHISLTMHTRLIQYSLPARVFHEMIHAIDLPAGNQSAKENRDGHYILSASRHASPGFPDPVYGCQFACYGGVGEDERKAMTRYLTLLAESNLDIPASDKNIACESYEDCDIRKRYAYLCDTAKPIAPNDLIAKDRKANRPTCIAEGLQNSCDAINDEKNCPAKPSLGPLCAVRCEILQGAAANGGSYPPELASKMLGLGQRLSDAYDNNGEGLSDDDAKVYAAAKRKGLLKSCN